MEEDNQDINQATRPSLKKKSKSKWWIWALVIIVVIVIGYVGYDKYSGWRDNQNNDIYRNGASQGYNQAILEVVDKVNTCEPVTVNYKDEIGNQTVNIFKVGCFN